MDSTITTALAAIVGLLTFSVSKTVSSATRTKKTSGGGIVENCHIEVQVPPRNPFSVIIESVETEPTRLYVAISGIDYTPDPSITRAVSRTLEPMIGAHEGALELDNIEQSALRDPTNANGAVVYRKSYILTFNRMDRIQMAKETRAVDDLTSMMQSMR
jgi:hypothetical protein